MADKVKKIVSALDSLGRSVTESTTDDRTLHEMFGWNFPPLNRTNIAYLSESLARRIEKISEDRIVEKWDPATTLAKIEYGKSLAPNFWNGNANEAYRTYSSILEYVEAQFASLFNPQPDWEKLDEAGLLPKDLSKKIRSLKTQINNVTSGVSDLKEQISIINDAYKAAQDLPIDVAMLEEAREKIDTFKQDIEKDKLLSSAAYDGINNILSEITDRKDEVFKILSLSEEAYSAATTKGLSEAFQIRADRTARSMWIWVVGLLFALVGGAISASYRVAVLETLLKDNASNGLISANATLVLITVAAPVWFAWIATKQIGHRFRLSEDYAFKASVAKAYEGYRREAARVDPDQAARLFKIAVDRLEEAPLRFVENETYGSPWHEALRLRRGSRKEPTKAGRNAMSEAEAKGDASDNEPSE